MKKIFTMLVAALCSMSVFADDIVVTSDLANGAYVEGAVQIGATTDVNVYIVAEKTIASALQCDIYLPEGLTAESGKSNIEGYALTFTPHPDLGNCVRLIWANVNVGTIDATTPVLAAKIAVSAVSTLTAGEVEAKTNNLDFAKSYNNETDNFVSTLTIQRAAVIDELPSDYALEVIPFAAKSGVNTFDIMFKAPEVIKDLEFDVTLPKGMFFYNSDFDVTVPTYVAGATATAPTFTIQNTDETTCHVKVAGAYNKLKKTSTGMDATSSLIKAFTVNTYVFTDDEVVDYDLGEAYIAPNNSVQQLKISNIKMGNGDASNVYEGKAYLTSVFYGTPAETDPVLYGHYTEGIINTLNGGVAKNFCTVDMTAATVDDELTINDALVYTPEGNTTYYRQAKSTYGTAVLPIASEATYYTYYGVVDNCIVFEPAENNNVPVDTPVLFSGEISGSGDGIVTPSKDAQLGTNGATDASLTFQGTYKTTYLNPEAGYYIAGDKFYNDGANVKAFRGYFTGNLETKSLRIAISDATGIHDITGQLSAEDIYNLQGIRQQTAKKGINIIGGKKVYKK